MSRHIKKFPLFALTVAAITFSMLAVPGLAQADGEVLDRRVNVALADSAPDKAFEGLATMIGLEAEVEPGLDDKITVRLNNVRMRTPIQVPALAGGGGAGPGDGVRPLVPAGLLRAPVEIEASTHQPG